MGRILKVKINGKIIRPGFINDEGTRLTMKKKTSQIYRNLNSIGIGIPLLDYLDKIRIKEIVIILEKEDKTEELFKTPINIWKLGKEVQEGKFEPQFHLTLTQLREITKNNMPKMEIMKE